MKWGVAFHTVNWVHLEAFLVEELVKDIIWWVSMDSVGAHGVLTAAVACRYVETVIADAIPCGVEQLSCRRGA